MDVFKVKETDGLRSFEAEGNEEVVINQLVVWRALKPKVAEVPLPVVRAVAVPVQNEITASGTPIPGGAAGVVGLEKLFIVDGETITLTAMPNGENPRGTALLLVLLGYLRVMKMPEISGTRLTMSLKHSGIPGIDRVDTIASQFVESAHVMRSGIRKGIKYKLSVTGVGEAERLARELLQNFPATV